jgi:hypothetical protein
MTGRHCAPQPTGRGRRGCHRLPRLPAAVADPPLASQFVRVALTHVSEDRVKSMGDYDQLNRLKSSCLDRRR